jgi:hypothetical protein
MGAGGGGAAAGVWAKAAVVPARIRPKVMQTNFMKITPVMMNLI